MTAPIESRCAKGIDTAVKDTKSAGLDSAVDGARAQPRSEQLPTGDDAVLARCQRKEPSLPLRRLSFTPVSLPLALRNLTCR